MGAALFKKFASVDVDVTDSNKILADWRLPMGSHVVIAKFTVASNELGENAAQEINSRFVLSFGDTQDIIISNLHGRDLKTVVMTVASTVIGIVYHGQLINEARVRLVCESTFKRIEVSSLTLTAMEFDSVKVEGPEP